MERPLRVPSPLALLPVWVALTALCAPRMSAAQSTSIGIYTEANGTNCSLTDNAPGFLRAYVVAYSTSGATAVRFSAPKPGCFTATYLADETVPGFAVIGNSQTGVSVAFGSCKVANTHVLTLLYQAFGNTPPCCAYPVLPDPVVGSAQYTDCGFVDHEAIVRPAIVNPDASCECDGLNFPPTVPVVTAPLDGATGQSSLVTLQWFSQDPEGQPLQCDVYLGETSNPPLVADSLAALSLPVGPLSYSTRYYWKVVARDTGGNETEGPVWTFLTRNPSAPPFVPSSPTPADSATGALRTVTLRWQGGDPDGDFVHYDLYFGTTPDPPLLQTPVNQASFKPERLALATRYYWRLVARDTEGLETPGPEWMFDTVTDNPPPAAPVNPSPVNGETNRPFSLTLRWSASDPEGDALKYDVYFGTDAAPPLYATNRPVENVGVAALQAETDHYWRIVAKDPEGGATSGPVWSFRTKANQPPSAPTNPVPAVGASISPLNVTLRWASSVDPDGQLVTYYVALGTTTNPPIIPGGTTANSYAAGTLEADVTYYWRVEARDPQGGVTSSAQWRFVTGGAELPPATPFNPNPADGSANTSRVPTLTWQSFDPDGGPLTYDVFFGTSPSLSMIATRSQANYPVGRTLLANTTYYWRIRARDDENATTLGPVWTFTTTASASPPAVPSNPYPPDGALDQPQIVTLTWQSSDPDGPTVTHDVYYGSSPDPPLIAVDRVPSSVTVQAPGQAVRYYWRVVAKDNDGFAVSSPMWSFVNASLPQPGSAAVGIYADASGTTCALNDAGAGLRTLYVIADGSTQLTAVRFAAPTPTCFDAAYLGSESPYLVLGDPVTGVSVGFGTCLAMPVVVLSMNYLSAGNTPGCCEFPVLSDPAIGRIAVVGCSFEELVGFTDPVLKISSNGGCAPCTRDGVVQVVANEDTCLVATPRQWAVDILVHPDQDGVLAAGIDLDFDPSAMTLVSCERGDLTQDWTAFSYVEQGSTISLSGTADVAHDPQARGVFARLVFESHCCSWNGAVLLHLANASGDFAGLNLVDRSVSCRYLPDGDVNNDAVITVADAQCALDIYLHAPAPPAAGCNGPFAATRANVDCSSPVTPGDAQCIFRHWLGQPCPFCGDTSASPAAWAPGPRASRVLLRAISEGGDVVVTVRAEGLEAASAFGMELEYPRGMTFVRAEGPAGGGPGSLQARVVEEGRVRIGAYAGGQPWPANGRDLVAVRLRGPAQGLVTARDFVDDLEGAPEAIASLDGGAPAIPAGGVVLHQNSPNPFNPRTTIRYELPAEARVRLAVYGVDGSRVKVLVDGPRGSGENLAEWDGTDDSGRGVSTGIYFCVLEVGGQRYQRKMVLLK